MVYTCDSCDKCFNNDKKLWARHRKACKRPPTAQQLRKEEVKAKTLELLEPARKRMMRSQKQRKYIAKKLHNQVKSEESEQNVLPTEQPAIILPQHIHPFSGLLNRYGVGYSTLWPIHHVFVPFPEQKHIGGPYTSAICNFIYSHRTDPSILEALFELDQEQIAQPTRFLLEKTMAQWTVDRMNYLRVCFDLNRRYNVQKKNRLEKQVLQQRNEIIPSHKWVQLAYYYNHSIHCVPGATFLTQTPLQCEQRAFRHFQISPVKDVLPQKEVEIYICRQCDKQFQILQGQYCVSCDCNFCFDCSKQVHPSKINQNGVLIRHFHKRHLPVYKKIPRSQIIKSLNLTIKPKRKMLDFGERQDEIRRKAEKARLRKPIGLYQLHLPLQQDKIFEELNSQNYHPYEEDLYLNPLSQSQEQV